MKHNKLKILLLDIETSPMEVFAWQMFDVNIGLNQVKKHTTVISWSAKWLGESKVFYMDVSKEKDVRSDKKILEGMKKLLCEADIVIGHNSKKFDIKKLNYRFVVNKIKPPSPYRQIDTLSIAKKYFKFDSNKLEHLAMILGVEQRKLTTREFDGFTLWDECLKGNKKAWVEMQKYNKRDTIVLEQVYERLKEWDTSINFSVYEESAEVRCCNCGSDALQKRGFNYTQTGKFQRFQCQECSAWFSSKTNLLSVNKKKSMLKRI